jgi:hypothetical protein
MYLLENDDSPGISAINQELFGSGNLLVIKPTRFGDEEINVRT